MWMIFTTFVTAGFDAPLERTRMLDWLGIYCCDMFVAVRSFQTAQITKDTWAVKRSWRGGVTSSQVTFLPCPLWCSVSAHECVGDALVCYGKDQPHVRTHCVFKTRAFSQKWAFREKYCRMKKCQSTLISALFVNIFHEWPKSLSHHFKAALFFFLFLVEPSVVQEALWWRKKLNKKETEHEMVPLFGHTEHERETLHARTTHTHARMHAFSCKIQKRSR